jgi:hypothetical protein
LIELKKSSVAGALGTAAKKAQVVVPIYNAKNFQEPLALLPYGSEPKNWPDLIVVSNAAFLVLRVRVAEAYTLLPFKRLDSVEIHKMGLLAFKDMLEVSQALFLTPEFTYQDMAQIANQFNLSGYVHKRYMEKK